MHLGSVLVARGQSSDGFQHLRDAETIMRHFFGDLDYRTGDCFEEIGHALKDEAMHLEPSDPGRAEGLSKAKEHLMKCLAARQKCFGAEDMRVGNVYLRIAEVKEASGDAKGAAEDFKRCREIWELTGKLAHAYLLTET